MIILTLRCENPKAQISIYDDKTDLTSITWQAHRKLAETLHAKIETSLGEIGKNWSDIQGIVFYSGPGSFTGLRIGASIANALASGLGVPVVSLNGTNWQKRGISKLSNGDNDRIVIPDYGGEVLTTKPKK